MGQTWDMVQAGLDTGTCSVFSKTMDNSSTDGVPSHCSLCFTCIHSLNRHSGSAEEALLCRSQMQ